MRGKIQDNDTSKDHQRVNWT